MESFPVEGGAGDKGRKVKIRPRAENHPVEGAGKKFGIADVAPVGLPVHPLVQASEDFQFGGEGVPGSSRNLPPLPEGRVAPAEGAHQSVGGRSAEAARFFRQNDRNSRGRRGPCRRSPGGTAAEDENIAAQGGGNCFHGHLSVR